METWEDPMVSVFTLRYSLGSVIREYLVEDNRYFNFLPKLNISLPFHKLVSSCLYHHHNTVMLLFPPFFHTYPFLHLIAAVLGHCRFKKLRRKRERQGFSY